MARLTCTVVTPEKLALETTADSAVLPLYDGEIGILPRRAPLIARLGFGEMRLRRGDEQTRYYLDGGFVQVTDDVISILTNRALPAEEIDDQSAQRQLDDALKLSIATDQLEAVRDRSVAQARAQIRVSRRA